MRHVKMLEHAFTAGGEPVFPECSLLNSCCLGKTALFTKLPQMRAAGKGFSPACYLKRRTVAEHLEGHMATKNPRQ